MCLKFYTYILVKISVLATPKNHCVMRTKGYLKFKLRNGKEVNLTFTHPYHGRTDINKKNLNRNYKPGQGNGSSIGSPKKIRMGFIPIKTAYRNLEIL